MLATQQRGDYMANQKKKTIPKKQEASFEKDAFLNSKSFRCQRDLLDAILEDGKRYTTKEVVELLNKEMKRKVEC